jgi:hypothetical protein
MPSVFGESYGLAMETSSKETREDRRIWQVQNGLFRKRTPRSDTSRLFCTCSNGGRRNCVCRPPPPPGCDSNPGFSAASRFSTSSSGSVCTALRSKIYFHQAAPEPSSVPWPSIVTSWLSLIHSNGCIAWQSIPSQRVRTGSYTEKSSRNRITAPSSRTR